MAFTYTEATTPEAKAAPFHKMKAEGLLPWAMSCIDNPTLERWLEITAAGVLLCCTDEASGKLLGCAHFTQFQGTIWRFDFTAFHAGFHCAAQQAQGGFDYMFERHSASAIVGITPVQFRHAWGLAEACGFKIVTRLPGACWLARKQRFVAGVMVMCTPQTLRNVQEGE
ncbi:N-acetyltransferase [uncultured Desulfovibrio sp.]|uniref:N-acetyltransferase n=1 Tax=uncultured Desulfovibrio sp. TaxID=167968 RepID=UPI002608F4A1|nr:N-acetyltransferase [uncultured Desulfovibrio sp.]